MASLLCSMWNGWFLTKPSEWEPQPPSFALEVLVTGVLSTAAFAGGVGGMDHGTWRWRRTCTSSHLNMSQRGYGRHWGRHQLCPVGPATVIRQVPALLKPGTGPCGCLACPWTLTSPLLCRHVLIYVHYSFTLCEFLPRPTAEAGNYAYAHHRRTWTSGVTSPWRPEASSSLMSKSTGSHHHVGYASRTLGLGLA